MPDQDLPIPFDVASDEIIALRQRTEALERQLAEVERATQSRLIQAELKAEAVRAGMVDLDGLKLLDITDAKVNERGEVEGAAALLAGLKRAKPWLFGRSSSSSSSSAPPVQPPRQKHATEMTDDEYRAARAALLKHRG